MAEEAVKKTRWLGTRQRAMAAIEHALSDFLPDHSRTPAETKLVHDIRSLTRNDHINSAELEIKARIVGDIKAVITERSNSS